MKSIILQLAAAGCLTLSASAVTITMGGAIGGAVVGTDFVVATAGTAAGVNNYPANEPPGSAIDANTATKYLNFFELNTGLIVTPTDAGMVVTGLNFTTANDAPERDPLTFNLYGSTTPLTGAGPFAMGSLTSIVLDATTGLTTDPGRFLPGGLQAVANDVSYASYLVTFPTVRDSAGANSMQISEITFDGRPVPEPGVAALGVLALAGLCVRRRR